MYGEFPIASRSSFRRCYSKLVKRLRDPDSMLRDAGIMVVGVVASKVLTLIAMPVISRLYTPEAFGVFGLLQAIISVFVVSACLRYRIAIVLPRRESDAAGLFWLSMIVVSGTTAVFITLLAICHPILPQLLPEADLMNLIWLMPLLLAVQGTLQVVSYWKTRQRAFDWIALSFVLSALSMCVFQILAGVASPQAHGLVWGLFIGHLTALIVLVVPTMRKDCKRLRLGLSWQRIRANAAYYSLFPKYNTPTAILDSASKAIAPIGLGLFFGPIIVGYYWLSERIIGSLSNLLQQSLHQVYLKRFSDLANQREDVFAFFIRSTIVLACVALVPTLILVLAGPSLFSIAFGESWIVAGIYARWMAIGYFFIFINVPAVQLISVFHLQKWHLGYMVLLSCCRATVIIMAGIQGNDLIAIALVSLCSGALNLVLVVCVGIYVWQRGVSEVSTRDRSPNRRRIEMTTDLLQERLDDDKSNLV